VSILCHHVANIQKKGHTYLIIGIKIVILPKIFKMKRICFVVDSIFSIGGVQRVTAVIAKGLAKDYDVTIVTFDNPVSKDLSLYGLEEVDIKYRFFSYPLIRSFKKWFCKLYSGIYLKLQPQGKWWSDLYAKSSFPSELRNALATELIEGQYDIIIGVHAPLAARLATLKPKLSNVRLIGWLHNSFEALFGDTSLYIGAERKRHYIYQFRKLDEIVVLSNYDANEYTQYDKAFKPIVIYNPLTLQPGKKSAGYTKRFLAVGRFSHKHKGFDLLIEAYRIFAARNNEWILDIVGGGPEEELYRSLITNHHLEERITLHPFTTHIQDYYSKAQVYILSSRWEGFGLVLVEAMAHGLPIISSNIPTSNEILGDFGMYFKNGDINELAQKLEEATHINWPEKSKQAIEIAHRFEVGPIIQQWKDLIEK
jgi:glycosyltransferase involved in cell wall biosynthesis